MKTKTNKTKFIILGTLVLIAAGATVYFFFIKGNKGNKDDKTDLGLNTNNSNLQGVTLNNPPLSKGNDKLVPRKVTGFVPVNSDIIEKKKRSSM